MIDLKSGLWDESYDRGENHIFFPKDETVKFLNRFVRKKKSLKTFEEKMPVRTGKALDFGCGIGRQTVLLAEFGFNSFGLDVSKNAISVANQLKDESFVKDKLEFAVSSELKLSFTDLFFDFGICDSVLDSMEFSMAKALIKEFDRVTSGLFFITLISDECNEDVIQDLIVQTQHEHGTIQSYYNIMKINELIKETSWKIKWMNLKKEYNIKNELVDARYHIVLNK